VIADGNFHVGAAIGDIDGDGVKEVVAGRQIDGEKPAAWDLRWFKPGKPVSASWTSGVIDPRTAGGPHDVLFADVDGDGVTELVVNAMYTRTPGLFLYRRPEKAGGRGRNPWYSRAFPPRNGGGRPGRRPPAGYRFGSLLVRSAAGRAVLRSVAEEGPGAGLP